VDKKRELFKAFNLRVDDPRYRLEKKNRGFDVQDAILENGADMRRKDLKGKMDRRKASMEMYQQKCKTILELYRVGYNINQFMKTYDTVYERNSK
jgi:hypothetical protein